MSEHHGADRVGHGEASLGDAQSHNPPDDPQYVGDADRESERRGSDAVDTDVEWHGEGHPPEPERGNEDPAPNAP